MPIFYTTSEKNDNTNTPAVQAGEKRPMKTRLDDNVLQAGIPIKNLELYTAADLLVSPIQTPLKDLDGSELRFKLLEKHVSAGILIQRKSGRDFTSSIPRLKEIQERMMSRQYIQPTRFLVELCVCADIHTNRQGECEIDGQPSGFKGETVDGAIRWWRWRGGYYHNLSRDSLLGMHINGLLQDLVTLNEHPELQVIRRPQQVLTAPDWRDTLATFPLISYKRAKQIADHCESLADALVWLSREDMTLEGIGKGIKQAARNYMGLTGVYEKTVLELKDHD